MGTGFLVSPSPAKIMNADVHTSGPASELLAQPSRIMVASKSSGMHLTTRLMCFPTTHYTVPSTVCSSLYCDSRFHMLTRTRCCIQFSNKPNTYPSACTAFRPLLYFAIGSARRRFCRSRRMARTSTCREWNGCHQSVLRVHNS
jgi:hypothetical protein